MSYRLTPINRFPLPFRDCTTTVFHGIFEDVVERVHGFLRINLITIFFTIFYVFYKERVYRNIVFLEIKFV